MSDHEQYDTILVDDAGESVRIPQILRHCPCLRHSEPPWSQVQLCHLASQGATSSSQLSNRQSVTRQDRLPSRRLAGDTLAINP